MPTPLEDRVTALEAKVADLEAKNAAGWAGFADGVWKKIEPYVTPIIVAACGAAVLWFQSLHGAKIDQAASAAQAAVQASDENGKKLDAVKTETATVKADVRQAATKADEAATNAAMAVQKADENHADVSEKLKAVQAAAEKPRPLFPPAPKKDE